CSALGVRGAARRANHLPGRAGSASGEPRAGPAPRRCRAPAGAGGTDERHRRPPLSKGGAGMSDNPRPSILRIASAEGAPDQRAAPSTAEIGRQAATMAPLLLDINALALVLSRSVPSLYRDDAAGRIPAAVRVGGSKRWRASDIALWVELGCPPRSEFEA